MSDLKVTMVGNNATPEVRVRAFARVYEFLLSLPTKHTRQDEREVTYSGTRDIMELHDEFGEQPGKEVEDPVDFVSNNVSRK